ncbi:hypothetical protein C2845_PM03G34730 [Panicum miliaceum]|uniref:Uncharacterized protein n=1 Tax=Panicum miliaceum TaxID=4540 RepID=A0A3L6TD53_PANMI|nr:hypothetical protein C2845_PM03G34730 [Panicum miliaceum]
MERKEATPMIIDNDNGAAMASGSVFPDGDVLAEELQLQEVILFSAFQQLVSEDTSVDSLLDDLFRQDHTKTLKGGSPPLMILGNPSSSSTSPGHEFCGSICMESVSRSGKFIVSPEPSCGDNTIEPEDCRDIIQPELFTKWGHALCESTLGKQRLYCMFSYCSVSFFTEDDGEGDIAERSRVPALPQAVLRPMWCRGMAASAARCSRSSGKTS